MTAPRRALVVGFGVTGRAVTHALTARGGEVVVVEDRPSDEVRSAALAAGVPLVAAPEGPALVALVRACDWVLPSPGVPERHPVFAAAGAAGVEVHSEFDLAAAWDDRPCLAITGTDGKTTVTMMVTAMLEASGVAAAAAGNVDVPLVAAIDDPRPDVFVVEASSFRLATATDFRPQVATWLNMADDHQDVHLSLDRYQQAKARVWANLTSDDLAVANADDPVVAAYARSVPRLQTFGVGGADSADWHVGAGRLRGPEGLDLLGVDELTRNLPHDLANALAASATALAGGADVEGVRATLRSFQSLPHRMQLVGEAGGVRYFDDSKATAPHATLAAVRGFGSVVLIAGGRNKGVDLGVLGDASGHLRAVVAIGEAAGEVAAVFRGRVPVVIAMSMDDAVHASSEAAQPGDTVVLSPACASFDWYRSYAERGDDFQRAFHLIGREPT